MSNRAVRTHIHEKLLEYCLNHVGSWADNITQYFREHPADRQLLIDATGELAISTLPAKFQRDQTVAAAREADDPDGVRQMWLFGVPPVRLSPVVEVAPDDWRQKADVSMVQQIAHSDRTTERCRRWTSYHKSKGMEQRAAASVMEKIRPGSSQQPIGVVQAQWKTATDDETTATVETTAADAQ